MINGLEGLFSMTLVPRPVVELHGRPGLSRPSLFLDFPLPLVAHEPFRLRCGHLHIHKPPHDVVFDGDYPVWIKQFGRRAHVTW